MFLPYLSGHTETASALDLIATYKQNEATGTLYLESGHETALLLFNKGDIQKHYALDKALNTDKTHVDFVFYQHAMRGHIELPSRFPTALGSVMRALPALKEQNFLRLESTDLQDLLTTLTAQNYTGYVRIEDERHKGLVLFKQGQIVIALHEAEQSIEEGNDALRPIRRAVLESKMAQIALRHLAPTLLEGLIALYKGGASHGLHIFNGLESSEEGYAFFKDGRAILRTTVELVGQAAYFPHVMTETAGLQLPDEPLGWEIKRYQLTLRGKDSLNAITELAMKFEKSFGEQGKRILKLVSKQQTPEHLAQALDMTLGDIKPLIDKLEREGLIRAFREGLPEA